MAIPPIQTELTADGPPAGTSPTVTDKTRPKPKSRLNAPDSFIPAWIPSATQESSSNEKKRASPNPRPKSHRKPLPTNQVALVGQEEEEDEETQPVQELLAAAPPWLVSLVLHLILMVALALILVPQIVDSPLEIKFFSEKVGDQLEEETFKINDAPLHDTLIDTESFLDETDAPLASPEMEVLELPEQAIATAEFSTPHIGLALTGREEGMRETLVETYGGDSSTEGAVYLALEWLKRQQQRDGSWRLDRPYSDGANRRNSLAATSLALLAFQGAGFTHKSSRNVVNESGQTVHADYRSVVSKAWKKMLSWQEDNGRFYRKANVTHPHQKLYAQAQATIAICELYGMTRDSKYRRPAQRAINFCCQIQDDDGEFPDGGWRYEEGRDSDTSVTGWFVMALQSARMAGLDVPSDVLMKVSKFLDTVTDEGSFYAYQPRIYPKLSMTAEGLLCRQYLGWKHDDPRLLEGVRYLQKNKIDWSEPNTYYWYYATQVMHHMEGDDWFEWNAVMKKQLTRMQIREGREKGSWPVDGDQWALGGGRLYQTCMCTFMLEVYYRHLPIYARL